MPPDDPQPFDPTGGLPDAPGDFGETIQQATPERPTPQPYDKQAHPFAPLTPQEEQAERARLHFRAGLMETVAGSAGAALTANVARGAPQGPPDTVPSGPGALPDQGVNVMTA